MESKITSKFPQTDSADIAIYLDETFPAPPLRFGDAEKESSASEATAGIFPALAKLNKVEDVVCWRLAVGCIVLLFS